MARIRTVADIPDTTDAALGEQQRRAALIVQGDFHASAAGRIVRSQDLPLRQPVHTVMAGTLGTGDLGFPSAYRRIESTPSATVVMEEALRPTEKNGFTVIDVTPEKITCRLFVWRPPQPSRRSTRWRRRWCTRFRGQRSGRGDKSVHPHLDMRLRHGALVRFQVDPGSGRIAGRNGASLDL